MASKSTPFPDAPIIAVILKEYDERDFDISSDALAEWLNKRWRKSGYQIDAEVVHQVLLCNGRQALAAQGDSKEGVFSRNFADF
ncbi:putative amidase family protein [Neofusicoccum parvum]|uniref:Amidase family protein n=1 Tax=Neofusicoccum parvum TaxID=310453 RepID=A0ACB5S021_9PEZI|nr:putative amidase family protein [Neofusicoccum parvum]